MTAVPQRRKAILYIGSGFTFGPNSPAGSNLQEDYRETLWFAHLANVNIYTFSSGLSLSYNNRGSRGSAYSQLSALADLAEDTGGVLTNPNRLDDGLDQMFLENSHYYLVGYQSTHPQMDGKFESDTISYVTTVLHSLNPVTFMEATAGVNWSYQRASAISQARVPERSPYDGIAGSVGSRGSTMVRIVRPSGPSAPA